MSFIPKHPFSNYKIAHEIFNNSLGRYQIYLYNSPTDSKTILRARYNYCVHIGYELPSNIQVDHINEDKTNDDVFNLQELDGPSNVKKHFDYRRNNQPMQEKYTCSHCGISFIEDHGIANCRKKQSITGNLFCSMACSIKSRAINNTLSIEEQNKIKELRKEGLSISEINKRTGYGENTIIKYKGDDANLRIVSKEKQDKIKECWNNGQTVASIVKELKVGKGTVQKYR